MSLLTLRALQKSFGPTTVVKDFNLTMGNAEFISLLGPSGCGKTTVLRMVAGFETPSVGAIEIDGTNVTALRPNQRKIGMMFQSYALFPTLTVSGNVAFGLKVSGIPTDQITRRVDEMLAMVGLTGFGARYPYQLSGGQQQRVALARAIAPRPRVLLLDEPLSALDAKIRVALRGEIRAIQRELGITMIFIAHDLSVVKHVSDRVMVMYLGRVMESTTKRELFAAPQHPYTQALLSAVPIPDPAAERAKVMIPLDGDLPSPMSPPSGCVFRTRCVRAQARCAAEVPVLAGGVACHFPGVLQPA